MFEYSELLLSTSTITLRRWLGIALVVAMARLVAVSPAAMVLVRRQYLRCKALTRNDCWARTNPKQFPAHAVEQRTSTLYLLDTVYTILKVGTHICSKFLTEYFFLSSPHLSEWDTINIHLNACKQLPLLLCSNNVEILTICSHWHLVKLQILYKIKMNLDNGRRRSIKAEIGANEISFSPLFSKWTKHDWNSNEELRLENKYFIRSSTLAIKWSVIT